MYMMKFLKLSLLQHSALWVCTISQLNYRGIVPVAKHLDARAPWINLNLVSDRLPFEIFAAVHITKLFMSQREGKNIYLNRQYVSFGCLLLIINTFQILNPVLNQELFLKK